MNATKYLIEFTVDAIQKKLEDDIEAALLAVETLHQTGLAASNQVAVSCEPPRDYYIFETQRAYRTPAVFLIADSIDFQKERGANFIDAKVRIYCSVVIEDRDANRLTRKAWRYQAALTQVLDQAVLQNVDGQLKMVVKVSDAAFSPLASVSTDPSDRGAVFRKEVSLTLTVEHFEQLF
jgi:hypothetical protein